MSPGVGFPYPAPNLLWNGPTYYDRGQRSLFFIGDSITWGWSGAGANAVTRSQAYTQIVQNRIGTHYTSNGGWVSCGINPDDGTASPPNEGAPANLLLWQYAASSSTTVGPFSGYQASAPSDGYSIRMATAGDLIAIQSGASWGAQIYVIFTTIGTGVVDIWIERSGATLIATENCAGTQLHILGPFDPPDNSLGQGGDITFVYSSGNFVITSIEPTLVFGGGIGFPYIVVQRVGRNSYAIVDYTNVANDIQNLNICTTGGPPIYVLAVGTVSMYDVARYVNPANYQSQLQSLASAFISGGAYPGTVILTIPLVPTTGSLGFGATVSDYRQAVLNVAAALNIKYIDLPNQPVDTGSSTVTYQTDGLHPTAAGHTVLGNKYIKALGL